MLSLILAAALVAGFCLLFEPRWETNDDVGMSMVAHGYGLAAHGSPNLVFSNVLWGYIVRAIPEINGVLGYSTASLATLFGVAWAVLYFLIRLDVGCSVAFVVVMLIIARPTLFPQFTINAGLLTVAAVIGWHAHERQRDIHSLTISCVLAFLGFLVRSQEFLLVLLVALPLLPWHLLRESHRFRLSLMFLSAAIGLSAVINYRAYSAPEWVEFRALDPIRAAYTDFRAVNHLNIHPEIGSKFGYTENDLFLIRHWFFADPLIANSKVLRGMFSSLESMPVLTGNIDLALDAVKTLLCGRLFPLVTVAIVMLIVFPCRKRSLVAWCIFIAMLLVMGLLGRPGIVPILST